MLIDLIATDNQISCNVKLAQIIGLEAAIYVNELINIQYKALRKEKINEDKFILDRSYMTKRTTLTENRQREIDLYLSSFKFLIIDQYNTDAMKVDLEILTSLLMCEDEKLVKEISTAKKQSKEVKEQANINRLKNEIKSFDPDVRGAYNRWIEGVVEKRGMTNVASIQIAQETLSRYTQNKDKQIDILKIAALNGYVDMQYAINVFEQRNQKTQSTVRTTLFDDSVPFTFTGKVY